MAQHLSPVVLAEDLSSVSSTHMVVHNHPRTPVPGDLTPSSGLLWYYVQIDVIHTHTGKTFIPIK